MNTGSCSWDRVTGLPGPDTRWNATVDPNNTTVQCENLGPIEKHFVNNPNLNNVPGPHYGGNAAINDCPVDGWYKYQCCEIVSPTQAGYRGQQSFCIPPVSGEPNGGGINGSAYAYLTDEDTEADAILRNHSFTPGTSCTAKLQNRAANVFTFNYVVVGYDLSVSNLEVGAPYKATVDLVEQNYGGGGSVVTTQRTYNFTATASTHSISDLIDLPTSGRQITVQNATVEVA